MPTPRLPLMLALLFLMSLVAPTNAQEETDESDNAPVHALLVALASVPDTPEVRASPIIASFVDYRVGYALLTIEQPTGSFAEATDDELLAVSLTNYLAGVNTLREAFTVLDEMPAAVGVDMFDIDYALEFGQLPPIGIVLGGQFDIEAITEAHAERDYAAEPVDDTDVVLLCGPDGCDSGFDSAMSRINRANPFGGALGRNAPLFVSDSLLLNSIDLGVLTAMQSAQTGEIASLDEDEVVTEIANLIYTRPYVRAVILLDPKSLGAGDPDVTPEPVVLPPMPASGIIALAQTADETNAYGEIIMTFASAEEAETAAAALTERLAPGIVIIPSDDNTPLRDSIDEAGELTIEAISDDATSLHTVRITITTPRAFDDPWAMGDGFTVWARTLIGRGMTFLNPEG
ncbi:MAG: hypothetical protein MUF38_10645 [Anaerolineae bacterium]|nr:hypothetical protein [Anaerolineae bacterium]